MESPRFTLAVAEVLILGVVLPALGGAAAALWLPDLRYTHVALHAMVEGAGSFIAVAVAGVVLLARRAEGDESLSHHWIACALLGMGVLDGFHAAVEPGHSFVWLHSLATFVGGLLSACTWAPDRLIHAPVGRALPRVAAFGALALGLFSVLMPGQIPAMLSEGAFTPAALALNVLGGLGFIVASSRFLFLFRTSQRRDELLFAVQCALFGTAGALFGVSAIWNAGWWWWHLLRLLAYAVVFQFVLMTFRRASEGRQAAVQELEQRLFCLQRETAAREELEKQLRESEGRFHSFMDHNPAAVFLKDEEGRYVYMNRTTQRFIGASADAWQGKTDEECFDGAVARRLRAQDQEVRATGQLKVILETIPVADGSLLDFMTLKFLVPSDGGRRFLGGIAVNITAQRHAEEALKRANAKLQEQVDELERWHRITMEREFRIKELRDELARLKGQKT
jgi:PAS domain S-box-containing protein